MPTDTLAGPAKRCIEAAAKAGLKLVTAESCTGGLIAAALTSVPGSSQAFERGFVTYSNEAKTELLGVPPELVRNYGAVSYEVVRAMAEGALAHAHADVAAAVTGIAGPTGGSAGKPIGLVYIASQRKGRGVRSEEHRFGDIGRDEIRRKSAARALEMMIEEISDRS